MNKTLRGINSYLEDKGERKNVFRGWSSYLTERRDGCVEPMKKMERPLPIEKRVFVNLPEGLPQRVTDFIDSFNRVMMQTETRGITFTKVISQRQEDGSVDMEWVENYFRVYFAFENNGDDTVGYVMNDTVREEFFSKFEKLRREDYAQIAKESIEFVIENKRR